MTTWHERLQEALTARTKDWPDLAKAVGKTKQSVYKLKPNSEDRTKQMDWDNAIKVCPPYAPYNCRPGPNGKQICGCGA